MWHVLNKKIKKKLVSTLDKLKNHIDSNPHLHPNHHNDNPHLLHHERTKKSKKSSQKIKYPINKCNLHDQRPKK